jgi:hypothetical protein
MSSNPNHASLDITRRQFVKTATLTAALVGGFGGVGARWATTLAADVGVSGPAAAPLYSFPLLGDLHYDKLAHHDMDWVRREKPDDERQMIGYSATTEKYTPRLLAHVADAVKASKSTVPFVIQVGDLVEGLCGNFDLAKIQFGEAFDCVQKSAMGVPMMLTKGNHDITGPGAPEAFDQVLLPWLSDQCKQPLKQANYTIRQADDLFVFFDAYKPDLNWLDDTLKSNKARQIFFVIHPPVVPYNARSNWIIFATEREQSERQRLLNLLGKYRAIVLSGHLHKYSYLTRNTDAGPIVQLAVISVIRNDPEKARDVLNGKEHYEPGLLDLEPKFSPTTVEQRKQLITAEAPFIGEFEFADLPGYAMVHVYADRVEAEIFSGIGEQQWKSRQLAAVAPPAPKGA